MTKLALSADPATLPPLRGGIVPVTLFQQNCTLLWDDASKQGVVVDPGGDLPRIRAAIEKTGLIAQAIWITHGHIDHAGAAAELKDLLQVPVVGPHKADKPLLDALPVAAAQYGMSGVRPLAPDRWLDAGDSVTLAGRSFEILHCPGHSPGSVVFFNRAERFALVGDVLFRGGVGRTDLPGGDGKALMRSIRDLLLPLGDDVQFICGHGPGSTLGEERRTNPFLQAG